MITFDPISNRAGRLRSGWRLIVFILLYFVAVALTYGALRLVLSVLFGGASGTVDAALEGRWGYVEQAFVLFIVATILGWGCGRALEDLPWRALGWTFHRGWWRDLLVGSLIGAASLVLAVILAAPLGGFRFGFPADVIWPAVTETLLAAGAIFIFAAAAEEVLFRGYPLQTVLRSWPAWVAVIPSSILFSLVHLANPNVVRGFTFINTALAGVWLAVAYLRTRSLWFPLGVHWAWNWTMGVVLGLPVSGITQIAPSPLLRAIDVGPQWLTGGDYGVEGGAACTVALLLSTVFIWRTRLVMATADLKQYTDGENSAPIEEPVTIRQT